MWYRLRRLNVPLRQTVLLSGAATGVTAAAAVGTGWLSPPRAHMSGGGLANATGRTPEWGIEHAHAMRTDWACVGANKASEDRLVVAEGGCGVVCAVFDGHYGPRAAEFCKQHAESYFAKVRPLLCHEFRLPRSVWCLLPAGPADPYLPGPLLQRSLFCSDCDTDDQDDLALRV